MADTNKRRGPWGWASKFFRMHDEDDFDAWTECSFQDIEHLVKRAQSAREGAAGFPEEFLAARERLLQEWLNEARPDFKENLNEWPAVKSCEKSEIAPFRNVFKRLISAKGENKGTVHLRSHSVPAEMLGSLLPSPYESHDSASTMNSKGELLSPTELLSVPDFPDSKNRLLGRGSDEVMAAEPRVDSAFSPTMRLKSFRDKVQRAFKRTGSGETPENDMSPLLDDY
ncbi:hypothetical protein BSKO_11451 [Bryopsis sp. KO-2023]|nr:hypothetical protein BSKO_11451 [Bryopsis sp. KO-2023]